MTLDDRRPEYMPLTEAVRVRDRACTGKTAMGQKAARASATAVNAEGQTRVVAYRCCFCGHHHIGHLMSYEATRQLAMAIRVLNQAT